MINHNDYNDEFLKKLIRQTGPDRPSENFTAKVMGRIEQQAAPETNPLITFLLNTWTLVVLAVVTGLTVSVIYTRQLAIDLLNLPLFKSLEPVFQTISLNIAQYLEALKVSPLTLIIMIVITALFILDRLIGRSLITRMFLV